MAVSFTVFCLFYFRFSEDKINGEKIGAACLKAYAACQKAIKDNLLAVIELHTKECPDCCWNGKKLVF